MSSYVKATSESALLDDLNFAIATVSSVLPSTDRAVRLSIHNKRRHHKLLHSQGITKSTKRQIYKQIENLKCTWLSAGR